MAPGDYSLTNHGTYELSGAAALATAVADVNITAEEHISGAALYLVPASNGQVTVLETSVATS